MNALRTAVQRLRTVWMPGYSVAVAIAAMLILGFLPFVKMGLVVNGFVLGAIIATGAIGLTLIYGNLNFANIAHGDYMAMGAYVAFAIMTGLLPLVGIEGQGFGPFSFGYPLFIALPVAAAVVAIGAIVLDIGIYRRLRNRGVNAVVIAMASLGLAIALRGLIQIIWTSEKHQFPREFRQVYHLPMDVRIPPDSIFIGGLAVVLVIGVYVLLTRTKIGKAMRATADNPDLARVSGIPTERVIWATWAIGGGLAAIAGVLLAVFQAQLLPSMGWEFLIPLFAAVILGGIGNPYGALVGALVIGVSMEVSTQWITPSYKHAVAFIIMIVLLLARPRGLLGGST
ncbi:MAG: branched-chain amino acid ABC transporter permease [Chloroflexi bacterium]|nr:branched-chain amino acid ABC transporter permease [Chloroflexota bacterium]